jgi:membrane protease YdiL (CAAX protease family)
MITGNSKKAGKLLIAAAPLVPVTTIPLFYLLVARWGPARGLLAGFGLYWLLWCLVLPALLLPAGSLRALLRPPRDAGAGITRLSWSIVWLPALGTLGAVFWKYAALASPGLLLLALLLAVINAPLEEMLWRGLYALSFPRSLAFGVLYPSLFFGLWHFALYFSAGNLLSGGAASLVGGAFVMGLIWGWAAWKTRSLFSVCLAHTVTNFFAFSGYLVELLGA